MLILKNSEILLTLNITKIIFTLKKLIVNPMLGFLILIVFLRKTKKFWLIKYIKYVRN